MQEYINKEANEVVNYFMDKGTTVIKKDYDYVRTSLTNLAKYQVEEILEKMAKVEKELVSGGQTEHYNGNVKEFDIVRGIIKNI